MYIEREREKVLFFFLNINNGETPDSVIQSLVRTHLQSKALNLIR